MARRRAAAAKEREDVERLLDSVSPKMFAPLAGKKAVITGASRGIGLAIATALAADGCDVALAGRSAGSDRFRQSAKVLCDSAQCRVMTKSCDVRSRTSVEGFFRAVQKRFPAIDILVNNAGISHTGANIDRLPPDTWADVLATNLTGMFLCTRAALPLMREGGIIVNNLSIAAKRVFEGQAAYISSKWGALGFTNCLREELRPRGIRVIALMPGATDTDIWKQFWPDAPRTRMISPESVAAAVVNAILLPANATVEELVITPTGGAL
jgi:NAD(P)-dependent dehydrogenase (short-subunit alcohol dehydrogenase family)